MLNKNKEKETERQKFPYITRHFIMQTMQTLTTLYAMGLSQLIQRMSNAKKRMKILLALFKSLHKRSYIKTPVHVSLHNIYIFHPRI